ncbi:MAG: plasmid recombination protein [Firmicutes bacterium]|nr:plasmid recombination protein [Bacillota bacterium]
MANYAIMRMGKRKMAAVGKIGKHHEREKEIYKSNPNIDQERTKDNYHIIRPKDTNYRRAVLNRIEQVGCRRRKDSVVLQDCFIGATPEWIKAKEPWEQKDFFREAVAFFEKKIGYENIISAVVHMDEATPHMHLCFVPITDQGRLSSKDIIGGPTGLVKWQDEFYEHMSRKYPDLTRGTPARVSHRKHIPAYMFKCAGELYKHYDEILSAINDIGMIKNGQKKEAAIALLGKYAPEMVRLKNQLQTTNEHIEDLERSLDSEISRNRNLGEDLSEKEKELKEANKALYDLNRQQKELDQLFMKIPEDNMQEIMRQQRERKSNKRKYKEGRERE